MSFFKPKEKEMAYETEANLPKYHFDMNGFLMFDDASLGGCAIYEVVPSIMTSALTHTEVFDNRVDTKAKDYAPIHSMEIYGDRRRDAVLQWVTFCNSLLPEDEADSQTHVQIILKKTHPDEWWDAYGYAIDQLQGHVGDPPFPLGKCASARRRIYEQELADLGDSYARQRHNWNGSSYKIFAYVVISYTPSSEGWWLDGRDDDYYVQDTPDVKSLFSVDGMVEKIGDMINNHAQTKQEKNEDNIATQLFPIEEDRIAQILKTRKLKMERAMAAYKSKIGYDSLAFDLRPTNTIDNSMLIAFWNNIMTPYCYKVWNLHTNIGDVILNMRNEEAIASNDASFLRTSDETNDAETQAFLSRYEGKDADDVAAERNQTEQHNTDDNDNNENDMTDDVAAAWNSINPELAQEETEQLTDEEKFLRKYQRIATSSLIDSPADSNHRNSSFRASTVGTTALPENNMLDARYTSKNVSTVQTSKSRMVSHELAQQEQKKRQKQAEHDEHVLRELTSNDMQLKQLSSKPNRGFKHEAEKHDIQAAQEGQEKIPLFINSNVSQSREKENPFERAAQTRNRLNEQESARNAKAEARRQMNRQPQRNVKNQQHQNAQTRPQRQNRPQNAETGNMMQSNQQSSRQNQQQAQSQKPKLHRKGR